MSFAANPKADQLDPSNAFQEPTGAITSDSLAAESLRSGGEFSKNTNAAELSVKGSNSTFTNTDTSSATTLEPARDSSSRDDQDLQTLDPRNRGVVGPKYPGGIDKAEFSGTHTLEGYTGGPTADKPSEGYNTRVSPGQGATAPTYAATAAGNIRQEGELKPKGDNLTEGGVPVTNTFVGSVGGNKDPGRLAEQKFEGMGSGNIVSSGNKNYPGTGDQASSGGQYDVLESERI